MLLDDSYNKIFVVLVETACQRLSVAKLREFSVDCSNDLYIVVFDKLKILFLVSFRLNCQFLVYLLVQFALLVLFPII